MSSSGLAWHDVEVVPVTLTTWHLFEEDCAVRQRGVLIDK